MTLAVWPTTLLAVMLSVVVRGAVMWDQNPALSQFPTQWIHNQLQQAPRRPSIPAVSATHQQQQQRQPLASAQLSQYEQQQLSALLNPYVAAGQASPSSAFSDSNFILDNSADDDDSINDLLFNAQNNNNNDALSPYAMELLREAYGSQQQVPVAEFKPIYGDNTKVKEQQPKTAAGAKVPLPATAAAGADNNKNKNNQKLIPTSLNDIERIIAENMFGPIVARESFKSLSNSADDDEPYVETADNVNRNAYSKLTKDDELRLNTEKRLSDASNTLIMNGFGGISSVDANDNDDGSGGGFGSTAHAMFSGKSRLSVMAVVFACTGAAIFGVIAAATFYRRVRTRRGGHGSANLGGDSNYPAYGVTGPIKPPSSLDLSVGDRKLAKSAETYHYQNQKRAMLATDRAAGLGGAAGAAAGGKSAAATDRSVAAGGGGGDESDSDLDEGSECGDYTVYECPGLAPAGCMEVQNPLFIGSDAESISPRSDRAEE